jgi:hypothetical protein
MLHVLKYYNWFAPMPLAVETLDLFCRFFGGLCKKVGIKLGLEEDNASRFPVIMSNEPSGASYRTFVFYA